MTTWQSALHGIRTSGDYFLSTFMFGLMFGITAAAIGIENWQALLMSASVFTASGQFAALEFWQAPLPLGTIALSVFLVSTRNLLMTRASWINFRIRTKAADTVRSAREPVERPSLMTIRSITG